MICPPPDNYRIADLIGQRFGRLTVVSFIEVGKANQAYWLCKCDCGQKQEAML